MIFSFADSTAFPQFIDVWRVECPISRSCSVWVVTFIYGQTLSQPHKKKPRRFHRVSHTLSCLAGVSHSRTPYFARLRIGRNRLGWRFGVGNGIRLLVDAGRRQRFPMRR